jgi:hypothetical protein
MRRQGRRHGRFEHVFLDGIRGPQLCDGVHLGPMERTRSAKGGGANVHGARVVREERWAAMDQHGQPFGQGARDDP